MNMLYSVFGALGGRDASSESAFGKARGSPHSGIFTGREVRKPMKATDEIFEKKQELVHKILRTRREMGMTQKNIEAACGVKQPVIARMERGLTDPQLTTILKVLRPLGKTLKIVDIEDEAE